MEYADNLPKTQRMAITKEHTLGTVTVIIPLFNKAHHIERAINSVLVSNNHPLLRELIVVNDGSTDGSERVVEAMSDSRIRLVHQHNAGLGNARNTGAALSETAWISFLDADDAWNSGFVDAFETYLRGHHQPALLIGAGRYRSFTSRGGKTRVFESAFYRKYKRQGVVRIDMLQHLEATLGLALPIGPSAFFVQRDAFFAVGGFPEYSRRNTDPAFWIKFLHEYNFYDWLGVAGATTYRSSDNMLTKTVLPDTHANPVRLTVEELSDIYQTGKVVSLLQKYSDLYLEPGLRKRWAIGSLESREVMSLYSKRKRVFYATVAKMSPTVQKKIFLSYRVFRWPRDKQRVLIQRFFCQIKSTHQKSGV